MRWRVSGILRSWRTWFTSLPSLGCAGLGSLLALGVEHDHGAARGADLLGRGLREALGAHGERPGQRAVAEDLEQRGLAVRQALLQHGLEVDHRAALEDLELLDVDDGVVGPEARVGEAALRHAPVDRHLAALVARTAVGARALAPALVAAP